MRKLAFALASSALALAAPASADTLHDALEAYALYQTDVGVLSDLNADSAATINGALARIARHDPEQVARGFIAYGAQAQADFVFFLVHLDDLEVVFLALLELDRSAVRISRFRHVTQTLDAFGDFDKCAELRRP